MKKLILVLVLLFCISCTTKPKDNDEKSEYNDEIYEVLDRYLDSFIFDKKELLDSYDNHNISWSIKSGDANISDNIISKNDNAQEYEPIELIAEVEGIKYEFSNIILCDELYGYLITYFTNQGENEEQLKYAFTFDGLLWFDVNDGQPILKPDLGTQRLRDPSLMRNKDGGFYLLATQGYDNPSIYVWDTIDLVQFHNERLVQVNMTSIESEMSESQAWAPEGFYDRRFDKYFIYWSSPNDNGMYYNWSNDMNSFTLPTKLLDCGFDVIDGTIFKDGYEYNIVLKDERDPMETYSQLFVGYSDSDYLNFDQFNMNYITGHQSEGPFIIYHGYNYVLYYDDYTRGQFKALYFYEFRNHDFYDVPEGDVVSSIENVAHASALPITCKEFSRINEVYQIIN